MSIPHFTSSEPQIIKAYFWLLGDAVRMKCVDLKMCATARAIRVVALRVLLGVGLAPLQWRTSLQRCVAPPTRAERETVCDAASIPTPAASTDY